MQESFDLEHRVRPTGARILQVRTPIPHPTSILSLVWTPARPCGQAALSSLFSLSPPGRQDGSDPRSPPGSAGRGLGDRGDAANGTAELAFEDPESDFASHPSRPPKLLKTPGPGFSICETVCGAGSWART